MAITSTTVNLSDTFTELVTQTNNLVTDAGNNDSDISSLDTRVTSDIGTLANLTTTAQSDLVSAINELQLEVTLQSDSAGGILFDSSELSFSIAPNTITSSLFKSAVSLQILDAGGSVLKTLHSPGE